MQLFFFFFVCVCVCFFSFFRVSLVSVCIRLIMVDLYFSLFRFSYRRVPVVFPFFAFVMIVLMLNARAVYHARAGAQAPRRHRGRSGVLDRL